MIFKGILRYISIAIKPGSIVLVVEYADRIPLLTFRALGSDALWQVLASSTTTITDSRSLDETTWRELMVRMIESDGSQWHSSQLSQIYGTPQFLRC